MQDKLWWYLNLNANVLKPESFRIIWPRLSLEKKYSRISGSLGTNQAQPPNFNFLWSKIGKNRAKLHLHHPNFLFYLPHLNWKFRQNIRAELLSVFPVWRNYGTWT